jgi:low temperature requirement protein LtrA
MIAGVVLIALGMKKVLEYVGDTAHHDLDDPLKGAGLYCLFFGVALYLVGHVAFKWAMMHVLSVARLVAAAAAMLAVLLVGTIPAIGQLGILAALVVGLVAYEVVRYAPQRDEVRHGSGTTTF